MIKKVDVDEWSKVLAPVQVPLSLSDQVYNNLLEAILNHQIKPGQHLVEQPLADQLSVSRISIREAIRRLSQDGLVEIIPSRGAYVIELTPLDVEEIYRLRIALECIALEKVIGSYQNGMLDVFLPTLQEMEAIGTHSDHLRAARLDNQFHRLLLKLSGLPRTTRMWEQMSSQIMMVIYTVSHYYPHLDGLADRHQPLLDMIAGRKIDQAKHFLSQHITEGAQNVLAAMQHI